MHRTVRVVITAVAALLPSAAWATEGVGVMPLSAVFLTGAGAAALGFGGLICLKLYEVLRGGELGAAWQTVAYALMFLAGALLFDAIVAAGWLALPLYVTGLLKMLAAGGLLLALYRFTKVLR